MRGVRTGFLCPNCHWSDDLLLSHYTYIDDSYRCNDCVIAKNAYKRMMRYTQRLEWWVSHQDYTVFVITVTLGNDVEKRVDYTTPLKLRNTLMRKMNRLRNRSNISEYFCGGYQAYEHTTKNGKYHPHLHMIALVPKSVVKNHKLVKPVFNSVRASIKQYIGSDYIYIEHAYSKKNGVKIYSDNKTTLRKALNYAMSYSMKGKIKSSSESMDSTKRTISTYGVLRGKGNSYRPPKGEPLGSYVL